MINLGDLGFQGQLSQGDLKSYSESSLSFLSPLTFSGDVFSKNVGLVQTNATGHYKPSSSETTGIAYYRICQNMMKYLKVYQVETTKPFIICGTI